MEQRILGGRDLARRDGATSHQEWIRSACIRLGLAFPNQVAGEAVAAFVDFGRWLAICPECGAAGYVDPAEMIFFCLSCGNAGNQGAARPVVFPADRDAIEAELLLREVVERSGSNPLQRAIEANPVIPGLVRCWRPGETVDDLRQQREEAVAWHTTQSPA